MQRKLVLGNWKMNGSASSNARLVNALSGHQVVDNSVQLGVCVPSIYVQQVRDALVGTSIAIGVQDVSAHVAGAYTGEISASMAAEFGVSYALVGHSERRSYHHESPEVVGLKAARCLDAGITPVICIGETLDERNNGDTNRVVEVQLTAVLERIGLQRADRIVIAYEPIWAIGSGLSATAEQAQETHAHLRRVLQGQLPGSRRIPILYGGSVKAASAGELFGQHDVDGGLVGGASLDPGEFLKIANAFSQN
jgi:triosephosphate isomerase